MIGVRLGGREPALEQVVGAALDGLPGGAEPAGGLGDGERVGREHAERIPARLGLALLPGDVVSGPAEPAGQLEDVGDEPGQSVVEPVVRKIDDMLSI